MPWTGGFGADDSDGETSVIPDNGAIAISFDLATKKRDAVASIETLEGVIEVLCGGEMHELDIEGFRSERRRTLADPRLKELGVQMKAWTKELPAVVIEATLGKRQVESLETSGPEVKDYYGSKGMLVLYLQKGKLPRGLGLSIELEGGQQIRIDKIGDISKPRTLAHKALTKAGVELTLTPVVRMGLHVEAEACEYSVRDVDLVSKTGRVVTREQRDGAEHDRAQKELAVCVDSR